MNKPDAINMTRDEAIARPDVKAAMDAKSYADLIKCLKDIQEESTRLQNLCDRLLDIDKTYDLTLGSVMSLNRDVLQASRPYQLQIETAKLLRQLRELTNSEATQ